MDTTVPHRRIAIVGSGFAGLGMAVKLKQAGIVDFVVLERGSDVGGTWHVNTYPGCQCDIPSHLYSFSFAPNPDWSRTYSLQPEIWEYLRRVSRERGIDPHIRFNHEVTAATWDEQAERWLIETSAGALTADILVAGPGPLSQPKLPGIEGIESFAGAIFHSAEWDHEHSLVGERVGVIGTGASSIQLVPHIQPQVGRLHLFQRTPPWVVPHRDRETTAWERALYRAFPPAQKLVRAFTYWSRELFVFTLMHPRAGSLAERAGRRHLREQVPDPELRAKLAPRYRIGCKRTLISNDYYPALQQPNVEVVTDPITAVTPRGIVTADGSERELDTIVLGTGFHVTDMPVAEWVRGRAGLTMDDVWQGTPQAYLGTTVAGFPNMFMLVGPNTGLGHNSIVFMIESQLGYVMDCLRHVQREGISTFEVREDVQRRFNEDIQRRLDGTVWTSGGCVSWYLDANGRNSTVWPGFTWPFRRRTRRFDPADYELRRRSVREPVELAAA
ncbi:MAG TPA: NAD(P)/FAD-dependent oxidoreductase [Solirubrobacteraceae bacterium]|nr:NAD(P)/FAD-dependent oxidoreductase [Solirubrobacteraceae bacterium]